MIENGTEVSVRHANRVTGNVMDLMMVSAGEKQESTSRNIYDHEPIFVDCLFDSLITVKIWFRQERDIFKPKLFPVQLASIFL